MDGLVLFGTNGEASSFSFQEKIECIQSIGDKKIKEDLLNLFQDILYKNKIDKTYIEQANLTAEDRQANRRIKIVFQTRKL